MGSLPTRSFNFDNLHKIAQYGAMGPLTVVKGLTMVSSFFNFFSQHVAA